MSQSLCFLVVYSKDCKYSEQELNKSNYNLLQLISDFIPTAIFVIEDKSLNSYNKLLLLEFHMNNFKMQPILLIPNF